MLFDYKLLHRGPANRHPVNHRYSLAHHLTSPLASPMVSMVFSNMFFLNTWAYVNRCVLATPILPWGA